MLPFTKRPGRGDESGDHDVVTKDDLVTAETVKPTANARAKEAVRAKFSSLSDDEMTNIMPSKSIGDALESARAASPRPAAGMPPPSAPNSARSQARPSPTPSSKASVSSATRSGKFAAVDDEEEDGRTVVRGAPKIVKRAPGSSAKMGMPTSPTTISPAAVIKATLESARAGKRTGDHLMAPPPKNLLEDIADLLPHPADGPGSENTKILMTTGSNSALPPPMQGAQTLPLQSTQMAQASLPPASTRPMSNAPPPMVGHTTNASGGYPAQQSGGYAAAQQSGGYAAHYNGPVPSGSVSAPGVAMPASMPAHFMVPQPPYSDGRIDPPGTAVTSRTKAAGRPATSWAMAVMAFALFVGVGAFAVMKGNGSEGFMETSASFVDPARAGAAPAAKAAAAAAAPVAPTPVPVAPEQPSMASLAVPPGVAVPPTGPGAVVAITAAPVVGAATTVTAAATPTPPAATAAAVAAVSPPAAPTARRPHVRAPAPAAEEPAAAPTAKPAPVAATPPAATAKPPRGAAAPKGPAAGGNSPTDEEQRAALKALQDSQLERSLGQ